MINLLRRHASPPLSGLLLASAFPVFHFYPLAWIGLVPLLASTRDDAPGRAAWRFFVAGYLFHVLLLQWMMANIMWAGGWAVLGQLALCAVLASFWAATGAVWSWIRATRSALFAALTLPVLWVAMEQLQGTVFTGLGWSNLGYSQGPDLIFVQWAAIGSAPFLSVFLVTVNALVALAIFEKSKRYVSVAGCLLIVAFAHAVGYLMMDDATYDEDALRVGIFQSNFPQEMKWDREYTTHMVEVAAEKSLALARRDNIDLMVWPEALVTGEISDPNLYNPIAVAVTTGGFHLFTGAARRESGNSYNSSYLIGKDASILGRYDKMHLAPFGEYVPWAGYIPFLSRLVPSIGGMSAGTNAVVMQVDGRSMGPMICFEMLFPPMAQRLEANGADFLTVITNLAWFGRSNAVPQELEITRLRAIETRLPVVHCANTGISGVFDPWGRFSMVNAVVDSSGRVFELRDGLKPKDIVMHRLVGSFDLPDAGARPVPFRPHHAAWVMVALAAGVLVFAGVFGGRGKMREQDRP